MFKGFSCSLSNVSRAGAESLCQPFRSPYLSKAVPNANPYHRNRTTAGYDLGHGAAQATQDVVIFNADDTASLAGGIQDCLLIDRFEA